MKILLIGPPGSGKGTLAQGLEQTLGIKHLSMGHMIRDVASNNPTLANKINGGALADDQTTKQILLSRLSMDDCQNGFILDGYPRSLAQAKNLAEIATVDFVFCLNIQEKLIFERLKNRLSCPNCNAVYSRLNYHSQKCAKCQTQLVLRQDDNDNSITKRIEVFKENINPILEFYGGAVIHVDVENSPEKTLEKVLKIIERGEKS